MFRLGVFFFFWAPKLPAYKTIWSMMKHLKQSHQINLNLHCISITSLITTLSLRATAANNNKIQNAIVKTFNFFMLLFLANYLFLFLSAAFGRHLHEWKHLKIKSAAYNILVDCVGSHEIEANIFWRRWWWWWDMREQLTERIKYKCHGILEMMNNFVRCCCCCCYGLLFESTKPNIWRFMLFVCIFIMSLS